MKGVKRWIVFLGAGALSLVLLITLARAFDIDPAVWVVQQIGREMEARRDAKREAHEREARERRMKEWEEAASGIPYRMSLPFPPLSRMGSEFQIAVKGEEVGLYQPIPGTLPPPDVWFIYVTIEYSDPQDSAVPLDTSWRLRIDETNVEPFRINRRELAYQDELVLTSVKRFNGEYARFTCIHASSLKEFRAATTVEQLAKTDDESACRTFLSIRPRVRLMVKFPIQKADVAHRALTRAIALMDRSIVDHPPPEE